MSATLTPTETVYGLRFYVNGEITVSNIQIEYGSSATSYESYTTSTTTIPTDTYFPTGMKSTGTAYDEFTSSRAYTRIGEVTLDGTQSYVEAYISGTQCRVLYLVSDILPAALPSSEVDYSLKSNYLPPTSNEKTWSGEAGIHRRINNSPQVMVSLGSASGITTVEEWNSYLSAHPLTIYYELAEEIVEPTLDFGE